ncbi:MAG TPA: lytic murein transglycosylase B [Spongiibacteraceae bacterium]|nr:lytic murein transglycosylase B [Spongiibacteraceae bacterium]
MSSGWIRIALRRFRDVAACALIAFPAFADYSTHPLAKGFVDEMVSKHGFERDEILQMLSRAERQQSILDAIARPAEKAKPWKDYRKIFVTNDRINQGVAFWRDHAVALARAERESGVPAAIIVAIIGVETRYGRNTGNYRVLDALTTLSFDYPPRADFFRGQLVEYFLMAREQKLAPDHMLGSYAGAMGFGQFMPSSYRKYAIDFDGDGVVDIINDIDDAIGSVANYLKGYGWQRGAPIVVRAAVKDAAPDSLLRDKLEPVTTLRDYKAQGIRSLSAMPDDTLAALFMLEGEDGNEYWLALNNFYVITRYNRSHMYSMAVTQLSQEISAQWSAQQ